MVAPDDIAAALGLPASAVTDEQRAQWALWIGDALLLIEARLGDPAALDQRRLDYVVREAVVMHAQRPDGATQTTDSVDDATWARSYSTGAGRVIILDEWWALLDPAPKATPRQAFTIDTLPVSGAGGHLPWCSVAWGASCSCGAVYTRGEYPLWEGGALS